MEDEQPEAGPSTVARTLPPIAGLEDEPSKPLTGEKKKKSKARTSGVIYVSRVPPGMTPHKVRHLMARWGEVGKVYAQSRDGECRGLSRSWCSGCKEGVAKLYGRPAAQSPCNTVTVFPQRFAITI